MKNNLLRIATRKSQLALWQAKFIKQQLQKNFPDLNIDLIPIHTHADKHLDTPLFKIGGKGLFVKELEEALLNNDADIAVHSVKDVPSVLPVGLELAVFCKRADPRDTFISKKFTSLCSMPLGATVGTSSLRRQCQIAKLRPDIHLESLRGNVDTRMTKIQNGLYDGIILAAAGLERLGLSNAIQEYFSTDVIIPAMGQGAIGIECRSDDVEIKKIILQLDDLMTRQCVEAERAMNKEFGGNCQTPVAGYAHIEGDQLYLQGMVGKPDGSLLLYAKGSGPFGDSETIGKTVAEKLFNQGAHEILSQYKSA